MYRGGLLNLLHRQNAKFFHINRENEENVDNTAIKLRVPNEKISTQINIGKLALQNFLPNDAQTPCIRHSLIAYYSILLQMR